MINNSVEDFYLQLMKNSDLKQEFDELKKDFLATHKDSVTTNEYKKFVEENILPLAEAYGFSFTFDEMFKYEANLVDKTSDSEASEIDDETLEQIAGGVSSRELKVLAISSLIFMCGVTFTPSYATVNADYTPSQSYSVSVNQNDNQEQKSINIDWNEKFSNMLIDTGSFFKNLIRFNSNKDIENYKQHNSEVEQTKQKAIDVTNNLNNAIKHANETLKTIENFYNKNSVSAADYAKKTAALQSQIQHLSENFKSAKENLKNKISNIPQYNKIIESNYKESKNNISKDLDKFNSKISPLYSEIIQINTNIQNVTSEINNLREQIRTADFKIKSLNNKISNIKQNIYKNESEIKNTNSRMEKLKKELNDNTISTYSKEDKKKSIVTLQKSILDLTNDNNTLRSDLAKNEAEKSLLENSVKNLNNSLYSKNQNLAGLQYSKNGILDKLSSIKNDIENFNKSIYDKNHGDVKANLENQVCEIDKLIQDLKSQKKENVKNPALEYAVSAKKNISDLLNKLKEDSLKLANESLNQTESTNTDLQSIKDSNTYGDNLLKGFFTRLSTKKEDLKNLNFKLDRTQTNINSSIETLNKIIMAIEDFKIPKPLTKDVENKISDEINQELKNVQEIENKIKKLENDTNQKFANSDAVTFLRMNIDGNGFLNCVSKGILL